MVVRQLFVVLFIVLLSGSTFVGKAQITFRSISEVSGSKSKNLRVAEEHRDSTQLELPFWDDFSRTFFSPDTSHWFVDVGTVNVSSSLGIKAPTVNVASFDGWNSLGTPYSNLELEEGEGDSLVSRFIDMSKINPALYGTVYLSFFWQKEGRGEAPDDTDSISLQLMNSDKQWISIWSKAGMDVAETDVFIQEMVGVNDPSFFHPYFQFRFQSHGRLSGGFDTWNIDYVYMNYNRTPADIYYEDRALNSPPSSWLAQYSAMPYDHFVVNLEQNLLPTRVGVSNLDDQVQPIEYYAQIRDSLGIYDEMNQGTPLNLAPISSGEIVSEPINPDVFERENDSLSLILETKFFITSGDSANWVDKYDLRSNDTTVSITKLDNELAYDDGTAEWAAGLSQKAAMLAYRYVGAKSDAITALKIYFPQFVPSSAGKTFTIIIWEDLLPNRAGRLLTEQHIVQRSDAINEFTTYQLGRPVVVSDTFYIGYEQSVDEFFPVGLDKFGKSQSGNVFINLDGVWEPSNVIDGNLMLRPVFGFEKAVGLEDEVFSEIKVYPNPNQGVFQIEGKFDSGEIMDILGNHVMSIDRTSNYEEIRLRAHKKGLYLLKLWKDGFEKTYKIIVR
jgi:hypothetical protein